MKKWGCILAVMVGLLIFLWLRHKPAPASGHILRSLPPEQALSMRSMYSQTPCGIIFTNYLPEPVQLVWLTGEGRREPRTTLEAGSNYFLSAFAQQAWIAVDSHNHDVALWWTQPGNWIAFIGKPPGSTSLK